MGKASCSTSEVMVDEELDNEDPGASCFCLDDTLETASVLGVDSEQTTTEIVS